MYNHFTIVDLTCQSCRSEVSWELFTHSIRTVFVKDALHVHTLHIDHTHVLKHKQTQLSWFCLLINSTKTNFLAHTFALQ